MGPLFFFPPFLCCCYLNGFTRLPTWSALQKHSCSWECVLRIFHCSLPRKNFPGRIALSKEQGRRNGKGQAAEAEGDPKKGTQASWRHRSAGQHFCCNRMESMFETSRKQMSKHLRLWLSWVTGSLAVISPAHSVCSPNVLMPEGAGLHFHK